MKTPSLVRTLDDGTEVTIFLYSSEIKEMKPLSKVDPPAIILDERKACDKAFALRAGIQEAMIWLRWLPLIFGRLDAGIKIL